MRKSLRINTVLNAVRMLLTVLVPLITFPYTSRVFLTEGNGKINFVTTVVQVFILFASIGVYSYGIREGTVVRDDKEKFTRLAAELFLINVIATVITYTIFLTLIAVYPGFSGYRELLLINGISIGFTALGLDWIYGVYEEYAYITIRQIAVQLFTIAAMFLFVHDAGDINLWMFMLTMSSVGSNVFNFIYARRYICHIAIRKPKLRRHLKPIMLLFATELASKVYSNLDVILLGTFAADHNIGVYSAAVKVNTILITFFSAMTPVFIPRLVEYSSGGNKDEYYGLLKKIFSLILAVSIPAVVGLEAISRQVIYLLAGEAFAEAIVTLKILAPIVLITSCANIFYYDVLIPKGKESCVLICTISGALVNLAVSILLIKKYAQNGTAIGSLVAETTALILAVIYCCKSDRNIIKKAMPSIWRYILGGASIVACCAGIDHVIESNIISAVVSVAASAAVYAIVLLVTRDPLALEGVSIVKKSVCKLSKK